LAASNSYHLPDGKTTARAQCGSDDNDIAALSVVL